MRWKKYALQGMGILAVILGLCVLFAGTIRTLTTPKVRFAPVKQGKLEQVTELKGKIVFPEEEELTLTVPEGLSLTVTRVLVKPGQQVKRGGKLLTTVVTDQEKTLASLQQEVTSAQNTLNAWERKNGSLRLTKNESLWIEAYDTLNQAEQAERNARVDVLALWTDMQETAAEKTASGQDASAGTELPKEPPKGADEAAVAAWSAWRTAADQAEAARTTLRDLDRYAPAEDVWTQIQQKREAEQKRDSAEARILEILLLARRTETITADHKGYVSAVSAEKGSTLSGDAVVLKMMPEGQAPVIRADISDIKQTIKKGAALSIQSDSWGRVETKVSATGVSETGHPYIDAEVTQDVIYALGSIEEILSKEISLRLTTRAQESTCLLPASAVRGSGDSRYVFVGEQETSAFAGSRIVVRKISVNVLAESASTVSIAEDLSRSHILYMEDRALEEGSTVMLYEE